MVPGGSVGGEGRGLAGALEGCTLTWAVVTQVCAQMNAHCSSTCPCLPLFVNSTLVILKNDYAMPRVQSKQSEVT